MPPSSNRPDVNTGQARTIHDCDQNEKSERQDTENWLFKVKQSSEFPYRIHVTNPDESCKSFHGIRSFDKAAYYVNMSLVALSNKLDENEFTEFFIWSEDLSWHINLVGYIFTPGDILEFTTSRGSSRPYPVEIAWSNKSKAYWWDSMGEAERYIGVYRGWFSECSKLHHGKPFKRRVTPWMELEPYNDSLIENMHAACTPSRGELEHGFDSKTGTLLLFIEDSYQIERSGFSKELIPHTYAMVKGKPVNGQTPFMVLNVTVKRCRTYECASELAYDLKITEQILESHLRSCDDEGVLWLKASIINVDRHFLRHEDTCPTMIRIKSPVRKFYVDPQVMIKQYQGNSLAEANFQNFDNTINSHGRTEIERNVESVHLEVESEVESAESEIGSDIESIESQTENSHAAQCKAENGGTSVFVEDISRNRIHDLFKYLLTKGVYFLVVVEGVPANGKVPYMVFNTWMEKCRMYESASEVAADMRITEKEFERILRMCTSHDNIEGKHELDPSAINFSRVRCNWEFDAQKKMGIQTSIKKFNYDEMNDMIPEFRTNSLTESDFDSDSDY